MDVGGGNGILLSHILRAHPGLRGVLADQEHVLDRARERGYLGGDLEARTTMEPCNFFERVPPGCRAYLMKSVIHDWDDDQARIILANCRKAIPADGVLLLVEWDSIRRKCPFEWQIHRHRHAFLDGRPRALGGRISRATGEHRLSTQQGRSHGRSIRSD